MKIDKILDKLLVFMKNEIEKHGEALHALRFDFSSEETLSYFNAPDEIKAEGEDLVLFKKQTKFKDESIDQCIKKALTDGYLKRQFGYEQNYKNLILTELGAARAESVKHNQKNYFSVSLKFFTDKLFIPILITVLTAVIVNYFNGTQTDKQIKALQEEIQWLKTSQAK